MKRLFSFKYVIFGILILAAGLRFWKLGSVPPGLTPDEAALGYNAFSILNTGRDEYGEMLPVIFRSFGDFKPGLYVYLTVPFVAILGLTEFAVRLPSAIAGILAVFLIYLVVWEFIKYDKNLKTKKNEKLHTPSTIHHSLPLLSAFLLAVSPWHIHYSRGAWEVNLALTLTLVGIYFFLKAINKAVYLMPSAVFFALTMLAYQGAKLSTLIVIAVLIMVFNKEVLSFFRKNMRTVVHSGVIALILAAPVILSMFQGKAGRLEVFSVFSYPRSEAHIESILEQGGEERYGIGYYLFHSESLNFARGVLGRYFNHFSTRFLFFEGDWQNPRHSAPNHGMMLLADLALIGAGIYVLANIKGKYKHVMILWLVLAPLPAALSRDQVHAVRSFNMVIPLILLAALGLFLVISKTVEIKGRAMRRLSYILLFTFYFLPFTYFLDSYFIHLPVHNAIHWFYGYKQVVETLHPLQQEKDRLIVQQSYNQPYIYFLFYQKYPPYQYQQQAQLATDNFIDVGLVESLDNIKFQRTGWPIGGMETGEVVVVDGITATRETIGSDWQIIRDIKYPDGYQTAFWVLEKI
jgi:4-amino-4-deoxy-L-arabinose transferase-like glycosyltransferase